MTKTYRTYQQELIDRATGTDQHMLIEYPTGSGKTLVADGIASRLGKTKRVLIATTQKAIEDTFADLGHARSRERGTTSSKSIERFLCGPNGVCVTTHSALVRVGEFSADQCVLILDEAHHGGEYRKLGLFTKEFITKGGRVIHMTATAFRTDNERILSGDFVHEYRSMSRHMAEGYAPPTVETELSSFVSLDTPADLFYGKVEIDTIGEHNIESLARSMIAKWKSTGKPKVIVRVPSSPSGAMKTVAAICTAFKAVGARVVNASGAINRAGLEETLRSERAREYKDSAIDVIVGCIRVSEGLDWPHCTDVYCVGVPTSMQLVIQLLGRAMRLKDKSQCEHWHRGAIRFFAPSRTARGLSTINRDHARHALLMCAVIHSSANASLYNAVCESHRRIQAVPSAIKSKRPRGPRSDIDRGMLIVFAAYQIAMIDVVMSGKSAMPKEIGALLASPAYQEIKGFKIDKRDIESVVSVMEENDGKRLRSFNHGLVRNAVETSGFDGTFKDMSSSLLHDSDIKVREIDITDKIKEHAIELGYKSIEKYGTLINSLAGPIVDGMRAHQIAARTLTRKTL